VAVLRPADFVLDVIIDPLAEQHDGFPTAAMFAEQIAETLQRLVAEPMDTTSVGR